MSCDTVRVSLLQPLAIVQLFAMDGYSRSDEAGATAAFVFNSVVGDAIGSLVP